MTDESKPPRLRGQKDREAAFRAGFLAGMDHAKREYGEERRVETEREDAMALGLTKLRATPPVKRTRRKRSNGAAAFEAAVIRDLEGKP